MVLSKILKNFKEKYVLTLYFEKIFGGVYFEKIFDSWLLWLFFDVVACTCEIVSVYKMMCLLLLNLEKVGSEAGLTLWTILELF